MVAVAKQLASHVFPKSGRSYYSVGRAYGGTLTWHLFCLGMAGAALLVILGLDQPTVLLLGSVCFLSVTLEGCSCGLVIGFTGLL